MQQFTGQPFTVVGFPCGQFDNQEPGNNGEILNTLRYVRPGNGFVPNFPLLGKIDVNGQNQIPLFTYLKSLCGAPGTSFVPAEYISWDPVLTTDITWNFEKFLVDKQGHVVRRYDIGVPPLNIAGDIQKLLASS
jgi:glutathione peroxidase